MIFPFVVVARFRSSITNDMSHIRLVIVKCKLDGLIEIFTGRHLADEFWEHAVKLADKRLQVLPRVNCGIEINDTIKTLVGTGLCVEWLEAMDKTLHDSDDLL